MRGGGGWIGLRVDRPFIKAKRGDGDGDKVTTGLINTKSRARGSDVLKGGKKKRDMTNKGEETREISAGGRKNWHGYPTENLSGLRLIGTHQRC